MSRIFRPSEDQITRAYQVIAEFESADTDLAAIDGKLIEKPVGCEKYRIVSIVDRIAGEGLCVAQ
ncbi:MAG: hypothetical protein OXI60_00625 [Acidiferrobacterales bacterium]|nr:hypothetical protein [Acidiferrobacterales bacterium]